MKKHFSFSPHNNEEKELINHIERDDYTPPKGFLTPELKSHFKTIAENTKAKKRELKAA